MSIVWDVKQDTLPKLDCSDEEHTDMKKVIDRALSYYKKGLLLTVSDHAEFDYHQIAQFQEEIHRVMDLMALREINPNDI